MIGIVGGVGPYAGIDLLDNIYGNTLAGTDQDYINSLLFSLSSKIQDRTQYLLGSVAENPGYSIGKIVLTLEKSGATVVGIPCNTAHSESIFSVIQNELKQNGSKVKLLHMIDETVIFITTHFSHFRRIGVLSTTGTYKYRLYRNALEAFGYETIEPTQQMQEEIVHPAIYHPAYGIKSTTRPFHPKARQNLELAMEYLKEQGAEAAVLGCTEIPLVIKSEMFNGLTIINPTKVLARALIHQVDAGKLKPFSMPRLKTK